MVQRMRGQYRAGEYGRSEAERREERQVPMALERKETAECMHTKGGALFRRNLPLLREPPRHRGEEAPLWLPPIKRVHLSGHKREEWLSSPATAGPSPSSGANPTAPQPQHRRRVILQEAPRITPEASRAGTTSGNIGSENAAVPPGRRQPIARGVVSTAAAAVLRPAPREFTGRANNEQKTAADTSNGIEEAPNKRTERAAKESVDRTTAAAACGKQLEPRSETPAKRKGNNAAGRTSLQNATVSEPLHKKPALAAIACSAVPRGSQGGMPAISRQLVSGSTPEPQENLAATRAAGMTQSELHGEAG
ncbi:hypothetical protein cyc_07894 [Cyclospora cayetanensis]|uniref:Uncharacterized protein n=1 Tax=Cyclospora cayetanensis TaxID=88456 RepID=A0A1D3D0P4_9EIME|nr:hypothetical protein cyc_07894 [Cyclospora cayetanensis]